MALFSVSFVRKLIKYGLLYFNSQAVKAECGCTNVSTVQLKPNSRIFGSYEVVLRYSNRSNNKLTSEVSGPTCHYLFEDRVIYNLTFVLTNPDQSNVSLRFLHG